VGSNISSNVNTLQDVQIKRTVFEKKQKQTNKQTASYSNLLRGRTTLLERSKCEQAWKLQNTETQN
jgi:hypothetical protein